VFIGAQEPKALPLPIFNTLRPHEKIQIGMLNVLAASGASLGRAAGEPLLAASDPASAARWGALDDGKGKGGGRAVDKCIFQQRSNCRAWELNHTSHLCTTNKTVVMGGVSESTIVATPGAGENGGPALVFR
jgi:hypothetical protein